MSWRSCSIKRWRYWSWNAVSDAVQQSFMTESDPWPWNRHRRSTGPVKTTGRGRTTKTNTSEPRQTSAVSLQLIWGGGGMYYPILPTLYRPWKGQRASLLMTEGSTSGSTQSWIMITAQHKSHNSEWEKIKSVENKLDLKLGSVVVTSSELLGSFVVTENRRTGITHRWLVGGIIMNWLIWTNEVKQNVKLLWLSG